MRTLGVLTFVAVVAAGFFTWWRRPVSRVEAPRVQSNETTQTSQIPIKKIEPQKPQLAVEKFARDASGKGAPFLPRPKSNGSAGGDASPMDIYRGMKMSDAVNVNGRRQLVLGARAIPRAQYNSTYGPVLFERLGFSIVGLQTDADPSWAQLPVHNGDRPVVVNPANGRLGVVTGTLMIKFADIHQADKLAGRESLELLSLDESIGVGYFKAPENYQLLGAVDRLRGERDVLRVELEVVEAFKGVR